MAWTEAWPGPGPERPPSGGADRAEVLGKLEAVCASRGLEGLAGRLADLGDLVAGDVSEVDRRLRALRGDRDVVDRSAAHLLGRGGKLLRPVCVALAARVGGPFDDRARELAVAVELVHCATLLHDDVVDSGDVRRGAPSARTVFGNAASIFAGDWLLVAALRHARRAAVPGALDRLLEVIDEMIHAEALQLESRGRADTDRERWLRIVDGKTAALFRYALFAGARVGALDERATQALERYGAHLGVAFQAVDDVLDLTGDAGSTGKSLFADLREGKMTWPLIVAVEREPSLEARVAELAASSTDAPVDDAARARVLEALTRTGAVRDCLAFARGQSSRAVACLDAVPSGRATDALVTVARAAIHREA